MTKTLLTRQKCVSLTEAEEQVLELLAGATGLTQSSYLRQAFIEKAVAQQAMAHPMADKIAAHQAAQAKA